MQKSFAQSIETVMSLANNRTSFSEFLLDVCVLLDFDMTAEERRKLKSSLDSQTLGGWHFRNEVECKKGSCAEAIVICAPVTFEPRTFDAIFRNSSYENNSLLYTDYFWSRENDTQSASEIYLPNWSPERFLGVDYLGPVLFVTNVSNLELTSYEKNIRHQIENLILTEKINVQLCTILGYRQYRYYENSDSQARKIRLENAFEEIGRHSSVHDGSINTFLISNVKHSPETISVIIPTHGSSASKGKKAVVLSCLERLIEQDLGNSSLEIIVVYDTHGYLGFLEELSRFEKANVTIKLIEFDENFNFSKKCNLGATYATGEVLVFLNDDATFKDNTGLLELAGSAMLPGVGAVGAKLTFPNGDLQHAGMIVSNGAVGHAYFKSDDQIHMFGDIEVNHEVIGVTGACLAQQRDIWETNGGWDEKLGSSYNDVDYCFRLYSKGLRILQLNTVNLVHHESTSRDANVTDYEFLILKTRWSDILVAERYFRMLARSSIRKSFSNSGVKRYIVRAKSTFKSHGFRGLAKLVIRFFKKKLKS